jgi:threonine synthase
VANQEKIFIDVGTAITIVAALKYALESTDNPTVNIRRAHTMKPKKAIDTIALLIPIFPNICFLEKVTFVCDAIPNPGMIRI